MHHALRRTVTSAALAGLVGVLLATPATAVTAESALFAFDGENTPQTFVLAAGYTVSVTGATAAYPPLRVAVDTVYHSEPYVAELAPPPGTSLAPAHTYPIGPGSAQVHLWLPTSTYCSSSAPTGTLHVDALTRTSTGAVATFAASYDAVCQGRPVFATIRFHSTLPWRGVQAAIPYDGQYTKVGTAKDVDVTLTGTGSEPVNLGAATIPAPSSFGTDSCSGTALARDQLCTIRVKVVPTEAGAFRAVLTLPADEHGSLALPVAVLGAIPPQPPYGLRAVAGDDGVGLTWNTSYYGGASGPPIVGYRVYRDGGSVPIGEPTGTSYVDLAAPGETHTYTVSEVAEVSGEGDRSAPEGATVPATTTDPGPVTGLAVERLDGDDASADLTLGGPYPGAVTVSGGATGVTIRPVSGAAWATGTIRAAVTFNWCTVVMDVAVSEARVHADGTVVALALSADVPCGGSVGTPHVELRYHATAGLLAPDTTPDSLTSPDTRPGATAAAQPVTITNHGSVDLVLGAATAPSDWALSADTCSGATVPPGASCTVDVSFAPASEGYKTGVLAFSDNTVAGSRRVRLAGLAGGLPSAVRDLTATPLVGRTYLSWTPPEHTFPGPVKYRVYMSTSPTTRGDYHYEGPKTSFVARMGRAGQRVYFQVVPINGYGLGVGPATKVDAVLPGRELLYTADAGSGVYHLQVQGLPGGAAVPLLGTAVDEEDPAYAPDGSQVAYTREVADGQWAVWVSPPDASEKRQIAAGAGMTYRHPSWSPDGKWLAFACRPLQQAWYDLCIHEGTGSYRRLRTIPAIVGPPSWLPSSNELAVVAARNPTVVQVLDRTGKYRYDVPGTTNARQVAASPEGGRIAWTRYEGQDVEPGTGSTPRYTLRVSSLSGGGGGGLTGTGYTNDPAWSNDGETVYYTHGERQAATGTIGTRDVFSVGATGGTPLRLTDTPTVDEDNPTVYDAVTAAPPPYLPRPLADFSGDGRPEIAVFRPGLGTWHIRGIGAVAFGRAGDVPVAADYTGDHKAEIAVFRPSTGTWLIRGRPSVTYGMRGDIPVPADYNGDGRADIAVFRPSTGTWYIRGVGVYVLGDRNTVPVPADYDGDHRADVAAYRPSTGTWYVRNRTNQGMRDTPYGLTPTPGDYQGLGHAEPAGFDGKGWYLRTWGLYVTLTPSGNDVPVWGQFDKDRGVEPGAFNPAAGLWRVLGQPNVTFGTAGDVPV